MSLILNFETSSKNCSVTLSSKAQLISNFDLEDDEYRHSELLTSTIKDILNQNNQKYINISLKPFMGVTLSKGTVCNLNFPKNSLIMQLESEDVDFDIEKKIDETI